ncbi:hypothetical protein ABIF96_005933 [Bradyrhizobium ottawaense]
MRDDGSALPVEIQNQHLYWGDVSLVAVVITLFVPSLQTRRHCFRVYTTYNQ